MLRALAVALVLLFAAGAAAQQVVRSPIDNATATPGTDAKRAVSVQGVTGGTPLSVTGTFTSSGAGDTVGASVAFNANSVCAFVATAGQTGAGFTIAAGTLTGTVTPSVSTDSTNGTNGTWTATSFVDISGNTSSSQAFTNPNSAFTAGIVLMQGNRYARVCTTAFTSGTATGFLVASTPQPRPPAAGADVTDRAGRLVGKVYGSDGNVVATANTGRLQVDVISGGGSNASVGATAAAVPASATYAGMSVAGTLTGLTGTANGLKVDGSAVTQPISAASLPLPTGAATSAKQPALGTAGTPSSDVITVQGVTSMTALKVDGSAVTQPVSVASAITANIGTSGSLALDATLTGGTQKAIARGGAKGATAAADVTSTNVDANTQALDVSVKGTPTVTVSSGSITASGTVTANQGTAAASSGAWPAKVTDGTNVAAVKAASTAAGATDPALVVAVSPNNSVAITASSLPLPTGAATETSLAKLTQAQGSTTSGQQGPIVQGAVTTAAPTYTTGQTSPLSLQTDGSLRVAVTAGGGSNASVSTTGTAVPGSATMVGGSDGTNLRALRTATDGTVRVDPTGTTTQPVSAASLPLPTGAATGVAQGSTTSGQSGTLAQGAVTTAAPTYTTGQTSPLSLDTTGALRVNVTAGGGTGGTSSSFGAAFPTTGTAVGFTDGTNMVAGRIKAASTAAGATDPSVVVALSPNSPLPTGSNTIGALTANQSVNLNQVGGAAVTLGQKAMSASIPVVPASDYVASNSSAGPTTISAQCTDANVDTACANGRVTLAVSGQVGATAKFVNSNVTQSAYKVDCSYDGGSTWDTDNYWVSASTAPGTVLAFTTDSTTSRMGMKCRKKSATHIGVRASAAITNSSSVTITAGYFEGDDVVTTTAGGTAPPKAVSIQGIASGTNVPVSQATAANLNAQVVGSVASGATAAGNPLGAGGRAATTVPTAVSDGQRVEMMVDKFGRQVNVLNADRALVTQGSVVTLTTTTETTLVAAGGANVFLDLTYIHCSNTSTTATRVDIRDATAGTVRDFIMCPAAAGPCEGAVYAVPFKQTTANNNWTVQLSGAVTDVRCVAQAVQNK